ncbi:nucleoside 2-deoxyribosyltransferase domain-containing protein [Crossiella sp. SN42]|uniref:nucleoside 2-deoxyribosyltransferase domain-containing protein n=1 Tax=Crossiella sp. SN42 TaxID=2944808 RepID=UPI00207CB480|nr:nucleoside 2-deoxyribosyltransferase domain-containing protein [Crossiella sp. SN42]MCO1574587.1 nucleoside 2-deoxyribosyltransferase domain-containing protein [Crossiella sp. SN42]
MGEVNLVMAREEIPSGSSVFLAGPTPERGSGVPSWRPDAVAELAAQWRGAGALAVLSPESRGGVRAERYEDQVAAELAMIEAATAVLFWIPRCVRTMPGFTTNVEYGLVAGSRPERAVLGCPPCPSPERNRYLIWHARRLGIPVCDNLSEAVAAALELVARTG